MPEGDKDSPSDIASLNREKARLRMIGIIVLSAGSVYWLGSRPPPAEDIRMQEYEESQALSESRQMQQLYGTSGGILEEILESLEEAGIQALLIIFLSGMIAAGCFYLGKPLPQDDA